MPFLGGVGTYRSMRGARAAENENADGVYCRNTFTVPLSANLRNRLNKTLVGSHDELVRQHGSLVGPMAVAFSRGLRACCLYASGFTHYRLINVDEEHAGFPPPH